ncbi:MAG: hypothetical protein HY321_16795 [Armatimonadetes bacterium]|nr:hypothetical protein [Armatimonadota bacterium]
MERDRRLPRWAPRVPQALIRRFYEADAQGICDEDLINEVGYALLARCESFITANRAREGELPCPWCGGTVRGEEILRCPCGWELPWADYFRTIQHKQLSGAEPVLEQFRSFVARFPPAPALKERVLLIDRLVHGFHVYLRTGGVTRPVAVNLIEGRLSEVVTFLDSLAYGEGGTPGLSATKSEWDEGIRANASWHGRRERCAPRETQDDR